MVRSDYVSALLHAVMDYMHMLTRFLYHQTSLVHIPVSGVSVGDPG